jgi:hypothetical protein
VPAEIDSLCSKPRRTLRALPTPLQVTPMDEAATALARPDYALTDSLWAERGTVFLTGTQALLRVLLMQRQRDAAAGLDTRASSAGTAGRRWARSTSRCGRPAIVSRRPASASCRR